MLFGSSKNTGLLLLIMQITHGKFANLTIWRLFVQPNSAAPSACSIRYPMITFVAIEVENKAMLHAAIRIHVSRLENIKKLLMA